MAKRLYMTSADYLAIAISPALIMALVGSLVFFLLEVLYVGDYEARLMYVFALFVFAAVLVSRISIEDGREYASMFALPLGLATFVVLVRFIEHPSVWSHLINLGLMLVIWWCADKLTWDCTVIDDNEDASGEGLMQRVGVDEAAPGAEPAPGTASNELFDKVGETTTGDSPWWQRWVRPKKRGHAPGLWVLYFSLAALPLFGVGQHWIPAADVNRRRYVFMLLIVYVAAALSLLVTTSFLGLRRYLRQRRIEMTDSMAGTWVAVGAVLIVIVMFTAALVPRPNAEYAISQVPWQAHSPSGLRSSRVAVGQDAPKDQESPPGQVIDKGGPQGDAVQSNPQSDQTTSGDGKSEQSSKGEPGEQSSESGEKSSQQPVGDKAGKSEKNAENKSDSKGEQNSDDKSKDSDSKPDGQNRDGSEGKNEPNKADQSSKGAEQNEAANSADNDLKIEQQERQGTQSAVPQHSSTPQQSPRLPDLTSVVGGPGGVLKLLFYIAAGIAVAVLAWRYRRELIKAIADILQRLRELLARLFGAKPRDAAGSDEQVAAKKVLVRTFAEFRNPFATGDYRRMPPEELVRYTFDAFEAWASDGGCPRSADQTPAELVRAATVPGTDIGDEARRMLRLYSEVAYASATIAPATAHTLSDLWALLGMRAPAIPEAARAGVGE